MRIPQAQAQKDAYKRLTPEFRRRGVVTKIYGGGRAVDLYFVDNPQTIVKNIPVSIPSQAYLLSIIGSFGNVVKCVVDIFNETNSRDMVVAYVY